MPADSPRLRLLSDLVDAAFTALDDAATLADELDLPRTRDHLRRATGMTGAALAVVELRRRADAPAVPAAAPLCTAPGCGHLPTVHARTHAGAPSYCDAVNCWCTGFVFPDVASARDDRLLVAVDPLLGTGR